MYGGLESQVMFGNREWTILDEAYGQGPINYPLKIKQNQPNQKKKKTKSNRSKN